jgi:hypothetical protein
MALLKCPEQACGKPVSSKAEFCPHCGCPLDAAGPAAPESAALLGPHLVVDEERQRQLSAIVASDDGSIIAVEFNGVKVSDKDLATLCGLKGLVELDLLPADGDYVTDRGVEALANIRSLKKLVLTPCNRITRRALQALSRMRTLEVLCLPQINDYITWADLQQFARALPRCRLEDKVGYILAEQTRRLARGNWDFSDLE